ncbi:MAG TPA: extracellular matrix/biofilm biosynthesis regulator RemA family protein [bacterium]|nr:extracellular matrix/biofilm biosynthesis regulator RemA family protein [bacterium]
MYVHLGGDVVVPAKDVVAILDARLLGQSEVNRELVERAVKAKKLHGPGIGPGCKALVVAVDAVYTSGISAPTLARRMVHFRQSALSWEAETQV